jgi:hypothetical protein
MKSFKEYLSESAKVYTFKVKIAGALPENFQSTLKDKLSDVACAKIEQSKKTPIQTTPLDFPELKNAEVHVFELACEYPITPPEVASRLKDMGLDEACFRVRNGSDPTNLEYETFTQLEKSGESILEDPTLASSDAKAKDYFGDDFNKSFLKDLSKTAKQKSKDGSGPMEYKLPKAKVDKAGTKSPIGTKELR